MIPSLEALAAAEASTYLCSLDGCWKELVGSVFPMGARNLVGVNRLPQITRGCFCAGDRYAKFWCVGTGAR